MLSDIRAAECHGFLCGQICISGQAEESIWWDFLNAELEDSELVGGYYTQIQDMGRHLASNLQLPYFEFQPMLPDDDTGLTERVQALGDWCNGFLNGFGMGTARQLLPLTDACREVLDDFSHICRVEVGEEISREEDELALVELVEYVRMGTILLYEEMNPSYNDERPEALH